MKLSTLFTKAVTKSGQFQIPLEKLELKLNNFKTLVESALGEYNQYRPYDKHFNINIPSRRQFEITADITGINDVPVWIADLIPIRIAGTYPFVVFGNQGPNNQSYLDQKVSFPWEYRAPVLTVAANGEFDLHGVFHHKIIDLGGGDYDLPTITDLDHTFIGMVTGKFMVALARNRRAFTVEALSITTDAAELAQDGKDVEKEAHDNLVENNSKFYLSYR